MLGPIFLNGPYLIPHLVSLINGCDTTGCVGIDPCFPKPLMPLNSSVKIFGPLVGINRSITCVQTIGYVNQYRMLGLINLSIGGICSTRQCFQAHNSALLMWRPRWVHKTSAFGEKFLFNSFAVGAFLMALYFTVCSNPGRNNSRRPLQTGIRWNCQPRNHIFASVWVFWLNPSKSPSM